MNCQDKEYEEEEQGGARRRILRSVQAINFLNHGDKKSKTALNLPVKEHKTL
jgi:hypothetical protein